MSEAWENERSEVKHRIQVLEGTVTNLKKEMAELKDFIRDEFSAIKVEVGKLSVKAGIWGVVAGATTATIAVALTWLR